MTERPTRRDALAVGAGRRVAFDRPRSDQVPQRHSLAREQVSDVGINIAPREGRESVDIGKRCDEAD